MALFWTLIRFCYWIFKDWQCKNIKMYHDPKINLIFWWNLWICCNFTSLFDLNYCFLHFFFQNLKMDQNIIDEIVFIKLENQKKNTLKLKLKKVNFCRTIKTPHLVFLDSHVEVTEGWLESLIGPIVKGEFVFYKLSCAQKKYIKKKFSFFQKVFFFKNFFKKNFSKKWKSFFDIFFFYN